jgi:molybdate transport system substrate-binding protein
MTTLHILSGGAAFGLVSRLEAQFKASSSCTLAGTYSAIGVMRDQLVAGAPCDVVILSAALIAGLEASGHVVAGSARALGKVRTGVAVKAGAAQPAVNSPHQLKAALLAARGIYFPDPIKATAGIHFMSVMKQLGIDGDVVHKLRPYPNGATAMAEMAKCSELGLIGCTQVTEILYTPGVNLVAVLPKEFELARRKRRHWWHCSVVLRRLLRGLRVDLRTDKNSAGLGYRLKKMGSHTSVVDRVQSCR